MRSEARLVLQRIGDHIADDVAEKSSVTASDPARTVSPVQSRWNARWTVQESHGPQIHPKSRLAARLNAMCRGHHMHYMPGFRDWRRCSLVAAPRS